MRQFTALPDSASALLDSASGLVARYHGLTEVLAISSGVFLVGSLVALPWIVVRLPKDHFLERRGPRSGRPKPWSHRVGAVLKRVLGLILVLAGIAMLVLPGQGVVAILLGMGLLDLPATRRAELWLLRHESVAKSINWMRRKAGRDPLQLPSES